MTIRRGMTGIQPPAGTSWTCTSCGHTVRPRNARERILRVGGRIVEITPFHFATTQDWRECGGRLVAEPIAHRALEAWTEPQAVHA